jgi:hypothetical protein
MNQGAVDGAGVGDRSQIVEQAFAQWRVVERDGGRCHLADEDRPQVRAVGAPIQCQNGVQLPAGGVQIAGAGGESRGDRVRVRGSADPPPDRLGRHVPQLRGVVAGTYDLESLRHPHVAGVAVADGLAERGGVGAEPLPRFDVAVEQGERGLAGPQQVVVAGLVQPLGEVDVLGQRGAEGGRSALQLSGRGQEQGLGVPFGIVRPLGQLGDLGGDRGPFGRGAGGPQGVVQGEQAAGQCRGVREGTGDGHRLFRQWPCGGPVGGHGVL